MKIGPAVLCILWMGLTLPPVTVSAQTLLNHPESAVFDAARQRYLVPNWGDGNIIAINSLHEESYFSTELTRAGCAEISGDILYVVATAEPYIGVVAFDLETADIVSYIPIADTEILHDICLGPNGNLYVTDCHRDVIFKIHPSSETYWVFHDFGSGMPYALEYDESGNRLLTVMQEVPCYPLRAVGLDDSAMVLIRNTFLPCVDGIARDSEGNTYLANCSTNAVHRYDPAFNHPPDLFSSGHNAPLDICINELHGMLVVPNWNGHSVDFVPLSPASVDDQLRGAAFPSYCRNPFRDAATVHYTLASSSDVQVDIFDARGRMIDRLTGGSQPAGEHRICWHAEAHPAGTYFYRIRAGARQSTGRMSRIR